jgi:uncharacterized protein (TIGR03083 family)
VSGQQLVPAAGDRGLASYAVEDLRELLLGAWTGFLELAAQVDLEAPTRLAGWRAQEVCVHLGSWPGARSVPQLVDEAARGVAADQPFDQAEHNAALLEAHGSAGRAEVLDRLERAREETAAFLDSGAAGELGTRPVRSVVGPLPLLTVVAAACFELAVHGLDLDRAGAPPPPVALLDAGVGAVTDTTGALAARLGIATTVACVAPEGTWAVGVLDGSWTTLNLPEVPPAWAAAEGSAATLLDVAAGRRAAPALLGRRELRLRHVGALLALAPVVSEVPGLPGGSALQGAVRHVSGLRSLVRRLPRLP